MKLNQAICLSGLLIVLFASICFIQAISSQSAIVKVEASNSSPAVGEEFNVTVSLANVQNLYGIEVILNWNTSVIEAKHVDVRLGVESYPDGVLHESSNSPNLFLAENTLNESQGEYRLVATSTAPADAFSGSGNIVKITFKATNISNMQFSLRSELDDYPPIDRDPRIAQPISHANQETTINVVETAISSPVETEMPTSAITPSFSATPTESDQTQVWNIGSNVILTVAVVIILLVVVALVLVFRGRKKQTP